MLPTTNGRWWYRIWRCCAKMRASASIRCAMLFNGLRYVVRHGTTWRAMPNDLPPWASVYRGAVTLIAACKMLVMRASSVSYKLHRFPSNLIARTVWLYFRFPLRFYLVDEMLLKLGIVVSYETIRRWNLKSGAAVARSLRRKVVRQDDI